MPTTPPEFKPGARYVRDGTDERTFSDDERVKYDGNTCCGDHVRRAFGPCDPYGKPAFRGICAAAGGCGMISFFVVPQVEPERVERLEP